MSRTDPSMNGPVNELESALRERRLPLVELRHLWEGRERGVWGTHPQLYALLAEDLRRRGEVFWCYDVATEGLESGAKRATRSRLQQLQAMALADSGAPMAARAILSDLLQVDGPSSESLSLLARTHKDEASRAVDPAARKRHLTEAREIYLSAWRQFEDTYPGINAASLSLLIGERATAEPLAVDVQRACLAQEGHKTDLWNIATQAEAALILGNPNQAAQLYTQAVERAQKDFALIASMRRQARLLLDQSKGDLSLIEDCFRMDPVLVFTGHRIDAPGRPYPRFPEERAEAIKEVLREQVRQSGAMVGYASAASGGDILFLEVLLELGGEVHVVLPFAEEAFCEISVRGGDSGDCPWVKRFRRVMEQATSVLFASHQQEAHGWEVFRYANQLIFGLAVQAGQALGVPLRGLALWNGETGDGQGGTSDTVALWQSHAQEVIQINPLNGRCQTLLPTKAPMPTESDAVAAAPIFRGPWDSFETFLEAHRGQEAKAILFADVVGFSKLTDEELPAYMYHLMTRVRALIDDLPEPPCSRNTWGDAFHFVFDSVSTAAMMALALRDLVQCTDWQALGFQKPLGIRIALHAGTVYAFHDPVTDRPNYLGYHINRTARIEPIAEEGQIYASESFAALAAFQAGDLIECEYAGRRVLPKGFGGDRVFVVHPHRG